DRVEQRTAQEKLGAEDLALGRAPILALAHQPDVQQLARVVPLVDGVREVDPLVALEADEPRAQHLGHHLGRFGLAHARLALDEQRLLQLEGEKDRGRERAVADVAPLAQAALDVLDRRRCAHGDKEYEEARPRRPRLPEPLLAAFGLVYRPLGEYAGEVLLVFGARAQVAG